LKSNKLINFRILNQINKFKCHEKTNFYIFNPYVGFNIL
jgi:hypothetical protein